MQRFALDPLPQPARWPRHSLQLCAVMLDPSIAVNLDFLLKTIREKHQNSDCFLCETVESFRLTSLLLVSVRREGDNLVAELDVNCKLI